MGFRFRKSIKIAPGVKLNFNKNSTSISIGKRGARYTVNSNGKETVSIGIPGTGLYYTESVTRKGKTKNKTKKVIKESVQHVYSEKTYNICSKIMFVLSIVSFLIGIPTFLFGGFLFVLLGLFTLYCSKIFKNKKKDGQ